MRLYHDLSNRCLPNVMKINVKINTMQKCQDFAFRSFTVLNLLKECLIAVGLRSDFWRKRLQACVRANGGHFNTFCKQTLANDLHFSCFFLVQVASVHLVGFLLCWCLIVNRSTVLNCKRTKSKMLIFCMVLFFALILTTFGISFICGIDDKKSHLKRELQIKFLIFKFSQVMQQHT